MRRAVWPALALLGLWSFSCGETSPTFRRIDTTGTHALDDDDTDPDDDSPPSRPDDDETPDLDIGGDASFVPLLGADDTCLSEVREAERLDVDLFVMLDRSASMESQAGAITKWEAVKSALTEFLENPESSGIGVGLGVFPAATAECFEEADCPGSTCAIAGVCPSGAQCTSDIGCVHQVDGNSLGYCENDEAVPCNPGSDCSGNRGQCLRLECTDGYCSGATQYGCMVGDPCIDENGVDLGDCVPRPGFCRDEATCDISLYSEPVVPVTLGAGRNDALLTALDDTKPLGFTPTVPALQGAIRYAADWYKEHPARVAAVVLATDGFPSECSSTSDPIAPVLDVARDGVALSPPIRTYVIGVFSQQEALAGAADTLRSIAQAGGTQEAFVVNTNNDATTEFLAALQDISATAIACEFLLPDDPDIDFGEVNLRLTEANGDRRQLVNIGSPDNCSDDGVLGWYYVSPEDGGVPFQISVCPNVCDKFARIGGGQVHLQIGCETILR